MTSTKAPPPIRPFWASFHLIRRHIVSMCNGQGGRGLDTVNARSRANPAVCEYIEKVNFSIAQNAKEKITLLVIT